METEVVYELEVGYSGWFRRTIVKAWAPTEEGYKEVETSVVMKPVKKEWLKISSTKKHGIITFSSPVGTIFKAIEKEEEKNKICYYIVTAEGLKELAYETEKIYVATGSVWWLGKTIEAKIWCYKNIIHLPNGQKIVDVDKNPRLYSTPRVQGRDWFLTDLERMKKEVGLK